MNLKKLLISVSVLSFIIIFSGCSNRSYSKVGTTFTGEEKVVTKKDVHAKTTMSDSIFLEPVSPEDQIVYFRFRNTSDIDMDIYHRLKMEFEKIGFVVTKDPKKANFMVLANLLKAGQLDENEQKSYLLAGFGGGALAAGATALTGGDGHNAGKAAAIGALVGLALEAASVKNVYYAFITDLEIRQRPLKNEKVEQLDIQAGTMGQSALSVQASKTDSVNWKKYRTRIISSAYAPGLEFYQARPFLEKGLIKALVNTM